MTSSVQEEDILLGQLNQGRRIDYVLQERPIESFNDYLFALGSHYSYWYVGEAVSDLIQEIIQISASQNKNKVRAAETKHFCLAKGVDS